MNRIPRANRPPTKSTEMGGGAKRRPNRNPGLRRLHAGDLPAKIGSGSHLGSSKNSDNNAVPYSYVNAPSSDDPSRPIHLASSTAVASVDPTPSSDTNAPVPTYNYDPALTGGLGLGFQKGEPEPEEEEEEESEEEEEEAGGFISIGGVRVYTEDTSSPEEDDVSDSGDEEDSTGSEGESSDEEDESSCDDDDDDSDEDDDEDDDGGGGDDDDGGKLGATDVMNESKEYGMSEKVKEKRKKIGAKTRKEKVESRLSAAMDDLMFEKDTRMVSGRRRKKEMKGLSQLSRSWPREGRRSRDGPGVPGI